MDSVADPVDAGITSDSLVRRIDEDDLEVLVYTILVDPVGLQNASSNNHDQLCIGGEKADSCELAQFSGKAKA